MRFLPGLLYEALVRFRNGLYSTGILPQRRIQAPVLSVGNLTLGGTGKTPLVIYLARTLVDLNRVPALLSRGYGRSESRSCTVVAPRETVSNPALLLGDEPALIRRKVAGMWLGVSSNRYQAGLRILRGEPAAVFILDDGFQHRQLYRNSDILIIDTSQDLTGNRIVPRGTLREPISGMSRAQAIVLNSSPAGENHSMEGLVRELHPRAEIFHCTQSIQEMIPFSEWSAGVLSAEGNHVCRSAYLVCAIGNPARFRESILNCGVAVKGERFFRDHQWIGREEWEGCFREAQRAGADFLVTTEKDAVKLSEAPAFPLLVAVQSTRIVEDHEFRLHIRKTIEAAQ